MSVREKGVIFDSLHNERNETTRNAPNDAKHAALGNETSVLGKGPRTLSNDSVNVLVVQRAPAKLVHRQLIRDSRGCVVDGGLRGPQHQLGAHGGNDAERTAV